MIKEITNSFYNIFSRKPEIVVRAPGRINLIGEHTDYNDGFVMPAAIDREIVFAASASTDHKLRVYALDLNEQIEVPISELDMQDMAWGNYLIGVCSLLPDKSKLQGINCVFSGNIPIGGGLSSSAAMTTGFASLVNHLFYMGLSKMELVKLSQKAEHEFAGVQCGIMDQFAVVFGKENHAIRLDCRTLEYELFPLNFPGYQLVLCDTKVMHSLASSEYNKRRQECEKGAAILREHEKEIVNLRDATPSMMNKYQNQFPEIIYRRCAYIVNENARVLKASELLRKNDIKAFGELMYETHDGLSKEYEVSCAELNTLVEFARNSGLVAGARMMGGGFGGCTLNIVESAKLKEFVAGAKKAFHKEYNKEPAFYKVHITNGVSMKTDGL